MDSESPIRTQPSVYGFIATDPVITRTEEGRARFWARFGQPTRVQDEHGTWRDGEVIFSNLVVWGAAAEIAERELHKHDRFIAQGTVRPYTATVDGQPVADHEFVAARITRYGTDRARRAEPDSGVAATRDGIEADTAEPARTPARLPRSGQLAPVASGSSPVAASGDDISL